MGNRCVLLVSYHEANRLLTVRVCLHNHVIYLLFTPPLHLERIKHQTYAVGEFPPHVHANPERARNIETCPWMAKLSLTFVLL